MSLLIAIRREPGDYIIAADSILVSVDQAIAGDPKIKLLDDRWVMACNSTASADTKILYKLDYARVEDPMYHAERFKGLKGDGDHMEGNYLLAQGNRCYVLNGAGEFWQVGAFECVGIGMSLAEYLITKAWPFGSDNLLPLLYEIFSEVAAHYDGVRLPMVYAVSSDVSPTIKTWSP